MGQSEETLTETQCGVLIDHLMDFLRFADEQTDEDTTAKLTREGFEDVEEFQDTLRTEATGDELVEIWMETVGEYINTVAIDQQSALADALEQTDLSGVTTPAHWQLEKVLNDEEPDFTIPTTANVLSQAIQNAGSLTFSHARLDFMLETAGMEVDDDGYIIDAETGEYKEPYVFDAHGERTFERFREYAHDTEDDPLDERLAEMREETGDHHLHRADRIHIEKFGGIIHAGVLPDSDDSQILRDSWFDMLELAGAGALTDNLKALSPASPVLTTRDLLYTYEQDAEAVFESDDEWQDPREGDEA